MITKENENVHTNEKNFFKTLGGYVKRSFLAAFYHDHKEEYSKTKIAESFQVSRDLLRKSLEEYELGKEIKPEKETRGRKSVKEKYPTLDKDIENLIDNYSQTDPDFKTEDMYVNLTINEVIKLLVSTGKYDVDSLPKKSAMGNFLNKLGYKLKKVKKTKPLKKVPETDAIFDNVNEAKEKHINNNDKDTVVISIDTKDKVKLGDYSRRRI